MVKSINDHKDFKIVNKALHVLGFDAGEIGVSVFNICALTLGELMHWWSNKGFKDWNACVLQNC